MYKIKLYNFVLWIVLSLLHAGCGGGGDSSPTGTTGSKITLSGTVQKGLFTTLNITAYPLDPLTGDVGESVPVQVTDQSYSIQLDSGQTLLLEATGEFINDVTGEPVTLDEPLMALVSVDDQDAAANINLLTTIVAEKTREALPGSSLPLSELIDLQETFVNTVFGLPATTDPDQLDYRNIQPASTASDPNLLLLLYSAGIASTLDGDQLFSDGFGAIFDAVVAAENPTEVVAALSPLTGLSLQPLYGDVLLNSGLSYLPSLSIEDSAVLSCNDGVPCFWNLSTLPSISVSSAETFEAEGGVRVFVRLSQISTSDTYIKLDSINGTAEEGIDYAAVDRNVLIPAGATTAWFDVPVVVDAITEVSESIDFTISTVSTEFSIFLGSGRVLIKDGYPASLNGQDATDKGIVSICLHGIGDPGAEYDDSCAQAVEALGIKTGDKPYATLSVDLALPCPTYRTCSDWLVDFYLVAENNLGLDQAEQPLGAYIYGKSLRLFSDPHDYQRLILSLNTDEVKLFVDQAMSNFFDVRIEARLGAISTKVAATSLPKVIEIPAAITAGDLEFPIGQVYEVEVNPASSCSDGGYRITADFMTSFAGNNIGSACVDFTAGDGTAIFVDGNVPLSAVGIALPENMTSRVERTTLDDQQAPLDPYGAVPSGSPLFILGKVSDLSDHAVVASVLHAEGLPFNFVVNSATLVPAGLELGYDSINYIMGLDYSSQDPRSNGRIHSNDYIYSSLAGQSGTILLTATGLQGDIAVPGRTVAAGGTSFPEAEMTWQGFTQAIVSSRLSRSVVNIDSLQFEQSTACTEPACAGSAASIHEVEAASAVIDSKGFMLADATMLSESGVKWGSRENSYPAWSRPQDLSIRSSAKLAVPGYVLPTGLRVADYLLSHLNESVSGDLVVYPLTSDNAVDGNYHPVGLSVGPEIYRDASSGEPDIGIDGQSLADKNLVIDNDVDLGPVYLPTSLATKYVIRNAGVTGVFNVKDSALAGTSDVVFYGYPLDLSRFAVRLTDNTFDSYTWIDGQLTLNGDAGGSAGLELVFDSLQLNCAGRLGNASLLYEACDGADNNNNGVIDENCSTTLYAWQAKADIFNFGFDNASQCGTSSQALSIDHTLEFNALNRPVMFTTRWSAAGSLIGQDVNVSPSYRFDKVEGVPGFGVQAQQVGLQVGNAVDGARDRYGWLGLNTGVVAVPFWDALKSDVRIANSSDFAGNAVAEPTVVAPLGELATRSLDQTNEEMQRSLINDYIDAEDNADLDANYQWGNTGFSFKLPVHYQPWQFSAGLNPADPDQQGLQSRFIGRTLEADLFVLDANAGVDFIEYDRTKLSFGASADFARLKNVRFQLDITDASTAGDVDDFLISLGIFDSPVLYPALSGVLDHSDILNYYAGQGLELAIRRGLEESIRVLGENAPGGQDPFVTVSELLATASSFPQQLTSVLINEIKDPLNRGVFSLEQELRASLADLETDLESLTEASTVEQRDAVIAKLQLTSALMRDIRSKVRPIGSDILTVLDQIDGQVDDVVAVATTLRTAISDIQLMLGQATRFTADTCNSPLIAGGVGNGYLDKIAVQFDSVRGITESLGSGNRLLLIAEKLGSDSGIREQMQSAEHRINQMMEELDVLLVEVDQTIRTAVCQPEEVDEVLAGALDIMTTIDEVAESIETADTDLKNIINELRSYQEFIYTAIELPLNVAIDALDSTAQVLTAGPADGLQLSANIDLALQTITADLPDLGIINPGELQVGELVADTEGGHDLSYVIFNIAKSAIDTGFNSVDTELADIIGDELPSAYYSADELRKLLVGELMRSAPLVELRVAMNQSFAEITTQANNLLQQYTEQINVAIREAVADVESEVNAVLADAQAAVRGMPLHSGSIDGAAIIAGNELERAYLEAQWTMINDNDKPTSYRATMNATSWSAIGTDDGPEACLLGDGESALDVVIATYNLPINMLGSEIKMEKLYLGFTLENSGGGLNDPALITKGIFGGITTDGDIKYSEVKVLSPAFLAGLGTRQSYLGASAGALFGGIGGDARFLVGRICPDNEVLYELDRKVSEFISFSANGFTGAYVRGGATLPIIPGGCFLNVSVSADFGGWALYDPVDVGGLIGGGGRGEIACIAALKGEVMTLLRNQAGDISFIGNAWGAAGAGWCDPGSWNTKAASRRDDWCGTGDAEFGVRFEDDKWKFETPKIDKFF